MRASSANPVEHVMHSGDLPRETVLLFFQLACAGARDFIVARTSARFGLAPFARDPALFEQTLKGRVEGTLVHVEYAVRQLLQAPADAEAVLGADGNDLEDHHVEGAWQQLGC